MRTIALIVGTRPEAIKLAPVYTALKARGAVCHPVVVAIQQHEVLTEYLTELGMPPDIVIPVERDEPGLSALVARLVVGIGHAYRSIDAGPDAVLVQGDTATAFAGALVACLRKIPIGHVEAGLRTYNAKGPFPEELHRQLIARMASIHFAPTYHAYDNLLHERVFGPILVTGNTVVDQLRSKGVEPVSVLVTCHRREGWDSTLPKLARALCRLPDDIHVVWPLHPNPDIIDKVQEIVNGRSNIFLHKPLPYEKFQSFLLQAKVVVTDSGGVVEEATTLGKPTIIVRGETERPEAVDCGAAQLLYPEDLPTLPLRIQRLARPYDDVFGDGHAGERIAQALLQFLDGRI